ncbi:uncharacterized protein LOC117173830 [Belonocnema kinseyi]|uniref:uncharacterized protein LOC117173830 n=1 Tax=Belonocnema kinseyi TaxID=2817044 RepID=UPI00143CC63A|nr:uncharacterized protein LOC117173830 [Belonocnema kinseyi]
MASNGESEKQEENAKQLQDRNDAADSNEKIKSLKTQVQGLSIQIQQLSNLFQRIVLNVAENVTGSPSHCNVHPSTDVSPNVSTTHLQAQNANLISSNVGEIKCLPFWKHDPETWFALMETQFLCRGITRDEEKLFNIMNSLDTETTRSIASVFKNPSADGKYDQLKKALLKEFSETAEQKLDRLFKYSEMGQRKPSTFHQDMFELAAGSVPRSTIITVWKERLPIDIWVLIDDESDEKKLVERAEKVHEIVNKNTRRVSALSNAWEQAEPETNPGNCSS